MHRLQPSDFPRGVFPTIKLNFPSWFHGWSSQHPLTGTNQKSHERNCSSTTSRGSPVRGTAVMPRCLQTAPAGENIYQTIQMVIIFLLLFLLLLSSPLHAMLFGISDLSLPVLSPSCSTAKFFCISLGFLWCVTKVLVEHRQVWLLGEGRQRGLCAGAGHVLHHRCRLHCLGRSPQ